VSILKGDGGQAFLIVVIGGERGKGEGGRGKGEGER